MEEILFVKVYTNDGMIPFKLQMIEVDELDTLQVGETAGGNRIVGGIEYNKYNKPVAYWIRQYGIDGFSLEQPRRIDANDVIFYYTKRRPSQIREMSDMSQTATRIRDTNEFMTAVSVKERIAACLSVFIKKQLPTVGIGRNAATENVGKHEYDGKTLTPGMIKELNAGDEVQVVNPTGQGSDATSFTKLQQRMIGAGQGLSYEATSRDMSETNYASARQGAIEDEMTYQEEEEAILAILDEIYETFVISCYLTGLIKVNGDFWTKKDDYLEHGWIKSPKKWIDPLKESSANKTALNTGQKTYKEIAAENGRDWKQQIDDNLEVIEYAKKKGYDLGGVIFDGKLGSEKEEPKPEPPKPDDQPETARRKEPTMMTRAHSPETEKKASQHQTKDRNRGLRELRGSIRALEGDGNERTFELSFSSEEPYTRWFGQEILDHSAGCVDLTRLNEIGCVLFNHDRDEVIGKITKAWIDNGRGMATIEFDSDEASEVIYQKVKGGTLKGVSVGYLVDNWEEVMPNKTSTDGRFMGPCSIAKKWAPYEISIVSVPADPTVGVGREMEEKSEPGTQDIPLDIYERQLQINKNRMEVKENDD